MPRGIEKVPKSKSDSAIDSINTLLMLLLFPARLSVYRDLVMETIMTEFASKIKQVMAENVVAKIIIHVSSFVMAVSSKMHGVVSVSFAMLNTSKVPHKSLVSETSKMSSVHLLV